MTDTSKEEEIRKKAIFDRMSPRRQKHILKRGYEEWDPFIEPKDPIDMREDKTKRTAQMLIREFLQSLDSENYSNEFGSGAFEICLGIINENEKFLGMFEFASWYKDLLIREGISKE